MFARFFETQCSYIIATPTLSTDTNYSSNQVDVNAESLHEE